MTDEHTSEARTNSDNQAAELNDSDLEQAAGGSSSPISRIAFQCNACGRTFKSPRIGKCPHCGSTSIEAVLAMPQSACEPNSFV